MHETICLRDGENQLKAKTKLIIALVVTTILIVYGIELSIRLVTGASERIEYLVVAVVIIALLLLVDLRLYGNYKKEKTG
jgi:purine-cytosine permease-like protein